MSELVEKVTRAIKEVRSVTAPSEVLAKAAIATVLDAIAEPSEAMHHAARDWSRAKYGKPIGIDASDGCWSAMIAALRREAEGE